MTRAARRIEVMHGVNLDQLGRRDPQHYGGLTFDRLYDNCPPTWRQKFEDRYKKFTTELKGDRHLFAEQPKRRLAAVEAKGPALASPHREARCLRRRGCGEKQGSQDGSSAHHHLL